jgi:uncharacterized protein (DUF1684 family)
MRTIFILLVLIASEISIAQDISAAIEEIAAYQAEQSEEFKNPETSILEPKDLDHFEKLDYYPIDLKFVVEAKFVRTPDEKPFLMPTTTDRLPEYVKYGEVHFEIDQKKLSLNLYQNTTPSEDPEYKDYLFLPFTDLTSGDGSYGGGRFMDAYIPDGETIVLDFNRSYNPYCAYNPRYSCPIPPQENDLMVRVEAGIKAYGKH